MLRIMRTTVNLPDALVVAARARAVVDGRTLTSLIAEGLRVVLQRTDTPAVRKPLPAFGNPDDGIKIDLLDRQALWASLDADGPR